MKIFLILLLIIGSAKASTISVDEMQRPVFSALNHSTSSSTVCPTSLPYTDMFAVVGPLNNCWTQFGAIGDVDLVVGAVGKMQPSTSNGHGMVRFTGATFSGTPKIQAAFVFAGDEYSAMCIVDSSYTGVCYYASLDQIRSIVNGADVGANLASCIGTTSGHTIKIEETVSTYTVTDVSISTVLCSGGVAAGTNTPGLIIDWRDGTAGVDYFGPATVSN